MKIIFWRVYRTELFDPRSFLSFGLPYLCNDTKYPHNFLEKNEGTNIIQPKKLPLSYEYVAETKLILEYLNLFKKIGTIGLG